MFLSFSFNVFSQCLNSSAYGSATAPSMGNSTTISTCNYYGEYSTISSVAADQEYTCDINLGGYVTVRSGSSSGSVVAHGPSPLLWTAASSGTHYVHWNSNSACGTSSTCVTTTIAASVMSCNNVGNGLSAPATACTANPTYTWLGMSNVSFGSVSNASGGQGYSDYTCSVSAGTAGQGGSFVVYATTAGGYAQYVNVFMDWDNDGTFNETYTMGNVANGATGSVTVNVPSDATIGNVRMRVQSTYFLVSKHRARAFRTEKLKTIQYKSPLLSLVMRQHP